MISKKKIWKNKEAIKNTKNEMLMNQNILMETSTLFSASIKSDLLILMANFHENI